MHALILGQTESGKTVLARALARSLLARGRRVIVVDPIGDRWPDGAETYLSISEPERAIRAASGTTHVFIDEAGRVFAEDPESVMWLLTRGRHYGANVYLLAQRAPLVPMTARDQCSRLYLFRSSRKDGETHAEEWGDEELRGCPEFGVYPRICGRVADRGGFRGWVYVYPEQVRAELHADDRPRDPEDLRHADDRRGDVSGDLPRRRSSAHPQVGGADGPTGGASREAGGAPQPVRGEAHGGGGAPPEGGGGDGTLRRDN